VDAELDALLAIRNQVNQSNPETNVSVNDFLIKACACALIKVPELNIQFDEASQTIRQFSNADIAVAVAIEGGLVTPIINTANRQSLSEISNRMRDLAARAKSGQLTAEEFQGGTFCISNLGMYGVRQFDAIINPPQGAILAVGGGEQRAVVKGGDIQVATVMTLSLSSDHRVIDGAQAAKFMRELKRLIESPALMLA
jgi:pyruvate dehydrogenase E2 component (dihydrolipoamide acetyltransferase)